MRLIVGVLITVGLISVLSSEPWSALSAAKSVTPSGEADLAPDGLHVISWNIQVFGRSKASKPQVMAHIVATLQHYDLIAIQEIRDKSQTAIQQLLEALNNASQHTYTMIVGERLGRSASKEQYAYVYRVDVLTPLRFYTSDDPDDVFHREPLVAHFQCPACVSPNLIVVNVHTDPDEAHEEVDALSDVVTTAIQASAIQDVLVLGDLNADCGYMNQHERETSPLFGDGFTMLIGDDVDTTTGKTHCAYDRLVVTNSLVPRIEHARVVAFDDDLDLDEAQTKAVSDHYPVALTLC
ncbi:MULTISPECIES: exonuclease/endonuclease/phosphatase family protein [Vibrio]|uniref:exonuclease/endonuclease/phosphatase family protein n=1 Tax=Vibrio TaxID=662 RepID=UPI0001B9581C|nr:MULTISPECIES: endonuclease/exonuclease/phosphatase family protein [Vibrio]EEX34340.1 deoxyribonuclease I-like 2 precursor (DNase I-like 2) [Vibrio coralliilyticus ATCC BAA-450]MDE3898386.1 endonuclease/exonuclease/phosphatase family protein [Vibrio sp. CC007]